MKRASIRNYCLFFSWVVALLATAISLYLSVVQEMSVCHLCWYQRICLYPLVIMLGIATFRKDTHVVIYALPLAALGFLFGLYQYLEQMISRFHPISLCTPTIPCSTIQFELWGFVTLPFLSFIASAVIIVLLLVAKYK